MGRLFWKFFAAFWVGLATVAAAVTAGVWLAQWFDLMPASRLEVGRFEFFMDTTRYLVETGDITALKRIELAEKQGDYPLPFVIDAQGRDLLG